MSVNKVDGARSGALCAQGAESPADGKHKALKGTQQVTPGAGLEGAEHDRDIKEKSSVMLLPSGPRHIQYSASW